MEQRDKVRKGYAKNESGVMIEAQYAEIRKSMPLLGSAAETLVQLANVLLAEARYEASDQDHLCSTE